MVCVDILHIRNRFDPDLRHRRSGACNTVWVQFQRSVGEASAKEGRNVEEVFMRLAREIRERDKVCRIFYRGIILCQWLTSHIEGVERGQR